VALSGLLAGSMTDPPALAFASNICHSDAPMVSYATVYPLTMVLRILSAQILVLLYAHDFLVLVLSSNSKTDRANRSGSHVSDYQ
jgi:hypothetical protein